MKLKAMNASKTSKSIQYQSSWKIETWLFPTTTLGVKNEFMVAKILNQANTTLTSGFVYYKMPHYILIVSHVVFFNISLHRMSKLLLMVP